MDHKCVKNKFWNGRSDINYVLSILLHAKHHSSVQQLENIASGIDVWNKILIGAWLIAGHIAI